MEILWPSTLPQRFLREGFNDEEPDNVTRTPMEMGRPKARRRTTTNVAPMSGVMNMTSAQYAALLTFYHVTVEAVLPFEFPNPTGIGSLEVTFLAPPKRRPARGVGRWLVDLSFEKQAL